MEFFPALTNRGIDSSYKIQLAPPPLMNLEDPAENLFIKFFLIFFLYFINNKKKRLKQNDFFFYIYRGSSFSFYVIYDMDMLLKY